MANELTYQSIFQGEQIDSRLAAVASLQEALAAVEQAITAKYTKPASGIPETDLDEAVQSALAKARSAVQDLSNYYTKTEIDALLSAVNSQQYVDVTALPTASADTLGKIYLVGPDANNQYARYYTSYDGSAYSWVAAGTTEINLALYATKEELSQLSQEVIDPSTYTWELGTINATTGAESGGSGKRVRTSYIHTDKNYVLMGDSEHWFSLRFYTANRQIIEDASTDWIVGDAVLANYMPENSAFFRIVGRNDTDTAISDAATFGTHISVTIPLSTIMKQVTARDASWDNINVRRLAYSLTNGKVIDARADSASFGNEITAANWGASQYIYLQGAKYARLYRDVVATQSIPSYSGVVFYDKDYQPLSEGVTRIIYGGGAQNMDSAGWTIHEIPEGAMYMRVGLRQTTAAAVTSGIELYYLATANLVDIQPPEMPYKYAGERITFGNPFAWRGITYIAGNAQSAAIYGKYAVFVMNRFNRIFLFDMERLASLGSYDPGLGFGTIMHCNQTQFGIEKYAEDDMFPVFYTAAQNDSDGRCTWYAFRIIPTLTDNVITAFTVELVQTIHLPVMTDANCLGNANPAIDYDAQCFWAYSRNNNEVADNYLQAKFTKFAIPALFSDGAAITEVTLSDTDILDSFDAPWSMAYAQGGFIDHGRLYIGQGGPAYGFECVRVIDLYNQRGQVSYIDLAAADLEQEPEGLFLYGDQMWLHGYNGVLYRFELGYHLN